MQVKLSVKGVEGVTAFLKSLPRGVVKVALPAIAEWIIGNGQRGLKHYQQYKYVARKRAYGQTFTSDKQRRFVMAAIREGRIDPGVPHRTGNSQRAYHMVPTNNGYGINIEAKGAGPYYTRHDTGQARLNALAGWKKTGEVMANNIAGAMKYAQAKVNAYLKGK